MRWVVAAVVVLVAVAAWGHGDEDSSQFPNVRIGPVCRLAWVQLDQIEDLDYEFRAWKACDTKRELFRVGRPGDIPLVLVQLRGDGRLVVGYVDDPRRVKIKKLGFGRAPEDECDGVPF